MFCQGLGLGLGLVLVDVSSASGDPCVFVAASADRVVYEYVHGMPIVEYLKNCSANNAVVLLTAVSRPVGVRGSER